MRLFGESLSGPPPLQKQFAMRWAALLGEEPPLGAPYRVTHKHLIQIIKLRQKNVGLQSNMRFAASPREPTVSGFANWVLRLYKPTRARHALEAGIIGEHAVLDRREKIHRAKVEIPRWENQGWRLIHDGIRGSFDKIFQIPSLTIDGIPLRGVPDLVFRERKSDRILIVELKVTSADLPSDGWPNLRAQLWAYGHIQDWTRASEILLAGEVWSNETSPPLRRKTYFWRSSDCRLNEECAELFLAYGGRVERS